MSGDIAVESAPGEGSVFSFAATFERATRASKIMRTFEGLRMLVVDDTPSAREALSNIVRVFQATSSAAASGQEALDMLTRAADEGAPFDVVLLDVHMPVMDGVETVRELRRLELGKGKTRVVALTASSHPDELDRLLTYGFDRVLTKPLRFHELFGELETLGEEVQP